MKVLCVNKKTGEESVKEYPRKDMKPIINLDKDIEFYIIQKSNITYDPSTQCLGKKIFEKTEEYNSTYPHLKNCIQLSQIIDLNQDLNPDLDMEKYIDKIK